MIRLPRHDAERGMSISMAILAITMVSFIMLYVGTQTLNSMYTARKKSDNSVGMAAGDSAIEKYRSALQGRLADESNMYTLGEAELDRLVSQQPGADVIRNDQAPGFDSMVPVLNSIPGNKRFTVLEKGTDTVGYWQLFHVIQPRYNSAGKQQPLVIYIRAWATAVNSTNITTKPRIFRVEYRPGYFSDYQSVTDAPFIINDPAGGVQYTINGPIHSNGYSVTEFLEIGNGQPRKGIWFEPTSPPDCQQGARFSTSQNTPIFVPGPSCNAAEQDGKRNARPISMLGVQDTYRYMWEDRNTPLVEERVGGGPYDVRFGTNGLWINNGWVSLWSPPGVDHSSLAVLLDGSVTVRGALVMTNGRAGRVTIATRRATSSAPQPQVYLRGTAGQTVGAANPGRDTVAVVTQGDVILQTSSNPGQCLRNINLAATSQAGSVTLPPEYVTLAPPAVNLNGLECPQTTFFRGSFAGHGNFQPSIRWPDVLNGGWTSRVGYSRPNLAYNRNLFLNPPPYYPLATPWGIVKAKDADDRCLTTQVGDQTCE